MFTPLNSPDDRVRLQHMLEAAQAAQGFAQGRAKKDLDSDIMFSFAVVRALEIVGEAAKNISASFKVAHPEIPWRDIGRTRDIYAHGYFVLKTDRVWQVLQHDLPPLIAQLEAILHAPETGGEADGPTH